MSPSDWPQVCQGIFLIHGEYGREGMPLLSKWSWVVRGSKLSRSVSSVPPLQSLPSSSCRAPLASPPDNCRLIETFASLSCPFGHGLYHSSRNQIRTTSKHIRIASPGCDPPQSLLWKARGLLEQLQTRRHDVPLTLNALGGG